MSPQGSPVVTLTAADDGYETLVRTSIFLGCQINDGGAGSSGALKVVIANETVTVRTLPGGYVSRSMKSPTTPTSHSWRR